MACRYLNGAADKREVETDPFIGRVGLCCKPVGIFALKSWGLNEGQHRAVRTSLCKQYRCAWRYRCSV